MATHVMTAEQRATFCPIKYAARAGCDPDALYRVGDVLHVPDGCPTPDPQGVDAVTSITEPAAGDNSIT